MKKTASSRAFVWSPMLTLSNCVNQHRPIHTFDLHLKKCEQATCLGVSAKPLRFIWMRMGSNSKTCESINIFVQPTFLWNCCWYQLDLKIPRFHWLIPIQVAMIGNFLPSWRIWWATMFHQFARRSLVKPTIFHRHSRATWKHHLWAWAWWKWSPAYGTSLQPFSISKFDVVHSQETICDCPSHCSQFWVSWIFW